MLWKEFTRVVSRFETKNKPGDFISLLVDRSTVSAAEAERLRSQTANFTDADAGLVLRHGLLDPGSIEMVLGASREGETFADAAERLGLLSRTRCKRVLQAQRLRHAIDVAEMLLLESRIAPKAVFARLSEFLVEIAPDAEAESALHRGACLDREDEG